MAKVNVLFVSVAIRHNKHCKPAALCVIIKRAMLHPQKYIIHFLTLAFLIISGTALFVPAPAYASHFSISIAPSVGSINRGDSISFVATATYVASPSEPITFGISSGLPPGAGAIFSTQVCTPGCSTVVTINTGTAIDGTYSLTVTGTASDSSSSTYRLTITAPALINYDIRGWAWSDNIGWISFNSQNCDIDWDGIMDRVNTGLGAGDASAPAQCPVNGTLMPNYGVNRDVATRVLSGYAWSDSIGWITFERSIAIGGKCGGGGGNTECPPALPYNATSDTFIAKLNTTGLIEGWARAANGIGEKWGWIKMSGSTASSSYGVQLNVNDFTGFAWGGDVMGWISFSSANMNTTNVYRVHIRSCSTPTASNLQSNFLDRCIGPFSPVLSFTYKDTLLNPLAQYTIRMYDTADTVTPIDTFTVIYCDGDGNGKIDATIGCGGDNTTSLTSWGTLSYASPLPPAGTTLTYVYNGPATRHYNKSYYFTVTVQSMCNLH